ncbi:IclR family transcriptional regulator [uncultured Amnibacterium sp.]|uniref:IclR family transcriptional regulator n=1 Tax=uncultured Amnibacterium sp. TaxID=1631851 RepID=UPI0035CC2CEE
METHVESGIEPLLEGDAGSRGSSPAAAEPVLYRAFRLLRCFDGEPMTLSELSVRTGTPLSTTLRLARQLVATGALERDEQGRYAIGLTLLEVASLAPRGHGLRALALPFMEDLHRATGEHVLLAVRTGAEAMIIERLSAHRAARVLYRVGERVPLHSTGVGLVLLAHADAQLQESVLAQRLTLEPEHEIVSTTDLRRRLAQVRQEGSATNARTVPEAASSVAAPIFDSGRSAIAAISVVAAAGSFDPTAMRPAVVTVARAISRLAATTDRSGLRLDR